MNIASIIISVCWILFLAIDLNLIKWAKKSNMSDAFLPVVIYNVLGLMLMLFLSMGWTIKIEESKIESYGKVVELHSALYFVCRDPVKANNLMQNYVGLDVEKNKNKNFELIKINHKHYFHNEDITYEIREIEAEK